MPKPDNPFDDFEQPVGLIMGRAAGSRAEWMVAVALSQLKLAYQYQVPIEGGRSLRGGQVLDFLVETTPLPTPLYVQGDYWHGSAKKRELDQWMMKRVRAAFNYQVAEPVEVWESEALTPDMAKSAIRKVLYL